VFSLAFAPSCKLLEKQDNLYVEVAKQFTEATIKEIFELQEFSFSNIKDINLVKVVKQEDLRKVLGEKIFNKLTSTWKVSFDNLKINTYINCFPVSDGLYELSYKRVVKEQRT
jgi:hypothetical protein